jgi:hypothetical protein
MRRIGRPAPGGEFKSDDPKTERDIASRYGNYFNPDRTGKPERHQVEEDWRIIPGTNCNWRIRVELG